MWEQDWALLGIAPTTELAAIKKAYALKLRVTRPDDDADAYQALRAAYERAQQWVTWQRDSDAVEEPAPPPTAAPAEDAPAPADEPASEPEHTVQPRHLIDELELRWRRSGEPALMLGWEEARRDLDQQPLSRQTEFSAAFAQWVLNLPELPDEFLKALDAHFGWLNDFRTERQLGPVLAQALHQALEGRLRPRPIDPNLRALAAPLLGLDALRKAGAGWLKLQWLLLLLQPMLARSRGLLSPQWQGPLGLDLAAQHWLREGVKRGLWLRTGMATVLCGTAAMLVFGDAVIATAHVLVWLACTGALLVVGLFAGLLIGTGITFATPTRRLALPLARWRAHRSQPLLSLIWLLFAAWLAYLDGAPGAGPNGSMLSLLPGWAMSYLAWGFAIAGLLLAWPLDGMHGCVVAGLSPLVGHLAMAAFGAWLPPASCLLLGAVWMLLAAAVHEERLGLSQAPLVGWLVRPMLNSFVLADRWTYAVALLPLSVAVAWATLTDGEVGAMRIFLVWVLSILAVGWLQTKADALGLRQLPATQPEAQTP